jgi:hypothetical protein
MRKGHMLMNIDASAIWEQIENSILAMEKR